MTHEEIQVIEQAGITEISEEMNVSEALTRLLLAADQKNLTACLPVLRRVLPVLAPMVGFDQKSPHHAFDVFTHTAFVVQNVPKKARLRWAALLHDIGKVPTFRMDSTGRGHFKGHAHVGRELAEPILESLRVPDAEGILTLIELHMAPLHRDKAVLGEYRDRLGDDLLHDLIDLQLADNISKGGAGNPERYREMHRLLDTL